MPANPLHRAATRVRRCAATLATTLAGLAVPLAAQALEFQPVEGFGIAYKTEVRLNASATVPVANLKPASYNFLEAVVTLNNLENVAKRLFVCVEGYTVNFDHESTRTEIDMTFDPKSKLLGCAISQSQTMARRRYGHMGCRQVALGAGQMGLRVAFVSGNHRATIKKANMKIEVDQTGPIQDGMRTGEKIIAFGGRGAGGHVLTTNNPIGGANVRLERAIRTFVTTFMTSADPEVALQTGAGFHCNRCFGMYSTIGDPPSTRTDFFLNAPTDAMKKQAQLKYAGKYDSLREILLAAGEKVGEPVDLENRFGDTALARLVPTFVDLPAACTLDIRTPSPEPFPIPPRDTVPALVEFDCDSTLPVNATADVVLSLQRHPGGEVLGDYWIKARNSGLCDVDADGDVDADDIGLVTSYRNTPAADADDPYDVDGDGVVSVLDARVCALRCTRPGCAR